jgi:uncharacterized membrane protein YphA (DoxX/SURF4 family)
MGLTKMQTTLMWVLSVLLAALFVFAGSGKLVGVERMAATFASAGYPVWFRYLIGIVEVACGITLLIPKYAIDAASVLIIVMLGALLTTIFLIDNSVIPPLITLLALGGVAALRGDE